MNNAELKALRIQLGLSQADAAEMVHVSMRCWQYWEAGERAINQSALALFILLTNGSK